MKLTSPSSFSSCARRPARGRLGRAASRLIYALTLALFALALGFVFLFIVRVFAPKPNLESLSADYSYAMEPMQAAMDDAHVQEIQSQILALGSRFLGQPGMRATEQTIRQAYERAGLEIHEQELQTVVPRTQVREVYRVAPGQEETQELGERLDRVQVYPFMPNHLQPVATPERGVTGELVVLTPQVLKERRDFSNVIGLLDATGKMTDPEYAFDWKRYASLGIKAIIVAHPQGMENIPWEKMFSVPGGQVSSGKEGMVSGFPVNYPRLAASPEVFDYVGQTLRLRVQVKFENTPNTTLVGILRAPGSTPQAPKHEALVLLTNYDACSLLPDLAPGGAQAVSVATQLALLEGLTHYRNSLKRDIVFVAFGSQVMAHDGDNNLLRLLDENTQRTQLNPFAKLLGIEKDATADDHQPDTRVAPWRERLAANDAQLALVQKLLALFAQPGFMENAAATEQALAPLPLEERRFFQEQITYVLDTMVFERNEEKLQAKLAYMNSGDPSTQSEPFLHFLRVKARYDQAVSMAGYGLTSLLAPEGSARQFRQDNALRARFLERFETLHTHHQDKKRRLEKDIDVIGVLAPYEQLIVFDAVMMPAAAAQSDREVLSFSCGSWTVNAQMRTMLSMLAAARQRVESLPGHEAIAQEMLVPPLSKLHHNDVNLYTAPLPDRSVNMWTQYGYLSFKLVSFERAESYQHFADPVDRPYMHDLSTLRHSLAVVGEAMLSLAHGNGRFEPIQIGWLRKQFGGQVLASGIGQSMVPRYPLAGATLASRPFFGYEYSWPGYYDQLLTQTDVYGRYEMINCAADFWVDHYIWAKGYSPVAAWHNPDGQITWIKDEGEDGQRLYKSVNLNWFNAEQTNKNVTIVVFRGAPVAFLDVTNPQSMKDYAGIKLMSRDGLAAFGKQCLFRQNNFEPKGGCVFFIEPDKHFYATLEAGTTQNELAKVIRGFMLGLPAPGQSSDYAMDARKEIDGPGYLASAWPLMNGFPFEIARSMIFLNNKRLEVQSRRNMADPQTLSFHEKSQTLSQQSQDPAQPRREAVRTAQEAVTYATLIHPVVRRNIVEAVMGILWYLALLVPFVYFFEKLLFCASDIRKQIAAQAVIFLVVFALLRVLHPAFGMVRSSLMILLGFVIILISGGMTILFSGKFKENLEELRKRRGQVDSAQVNRLGVLGSAFMLGLNNMHRRKVRTWLTCATLSLITFAMICFTSVSSSIVEESKAIGKAPYQGLLIKQEGYKRITDTELFALRSRYEDKYRIHVRRMHLGIQNWEDKQGHNPKLELVHKDSDLRRLANPKSILQFTHDDPLSRQIKLLTTRQGWFTLDQEKSEQGLCPLFLPEQLADRLGITPGMVDAAPVTVTMNGRQFEVAGIFDSASLGQAVDLDGVNILPYDVEAMGHIQLVDEQIVAEDNDPRIPPGQIVLAPLRNLNIQIPNNSPADISVALEMPQGSYKQVKEQIDAYLEQSGKPTYYGLAGVAYRGKRTRESSLKGLVELLLPLLIAALTVLNTMKGSVYERRGEIAVYNAVGIAPRYIFFMFIAEAIVYAVVGSVLGYLLSQGTGRVLTALNLTGGLNMTFASIHTIYASLAVAAAVLISTYFPARSAMEIAKPAEKAGWELPEPQGDTLEFDLPFNFTPLGRVAVLAFFERYLQDHGEGGAGRFHAADPRICLSARPEDQEEPTSVPMISATLWLKPFDLGVSQTLEICMVTDHETSEYKARVTLTRLSGAREGWLRLNRSLVAQIRRQFLHWRAVGEADRAALFEEARGHLMQNLEVSEQS